MKNFKQLVCTVIVLITFSCRQHKTDIKELVEQFADLECRAISLREKRFALANQIRFTQDTLLQKTGKADTSTLKLKLDYYNNDKAVTLQHSLALADSIRSRLNDIMKNQLTNEADKTAFNDLLNKTLQQKGCVEK